MIQTDNAITINTRYQCVKSILDWFAALILLILFSPILVLVAILIKLDSRGPALYRQQRVGQGGKIFTILKYRSMHVGTPSISTEDLQRSNISPITRVGAVLRKTSVDEIPQLLNILRGEMSFIGPRPALPSQEDVNQLREKLGVDAVRPGITGYAQVMGRDDLDTETKVNYDAEYGRRMSLGFDVKIVCMTLGAIISSRGNK